MVVYYKQRRTSEIFETSSTVLQIAVNMPWANHKDEWDTSNIRYMQIAAKKKKPDSLWIHVPMYSVFLEIFTSMSLMRHQSVIKCSSCGSLHPVHLRATLSRMYVMRDLTMIHSNILQFILEQITALNNFALLQQF